MSTRSKSGLRLAFWPLQLGGWLVFAVASATSNLPLRHDRGLVAFRTAFVLSTFLASFITYGICRAVRLSRSPVVSTIAIGTATCAVLGFFCSAAAVWSEIHFGGVDVSFHWSTALSNMTGGAFVLIAWCAIYSGVKQYQALEREQERLHAAEATAREAQLLALRYQLQPHFLFNTLNAISSLIVGQEPKQATQMISRLGDLLRSTLDEPDTHFVSLADELILVKEYLSIEEIRFGPRLRTSFDVLPETLVMTVPRFILQPLVENAIRHGIAHLPAGGSIRLQTIATSRQVEIAVENDVEWRLSAPETTGLGLSNTRERLTQIYGNQASLVTKHERGKSFTVTLSLPYESRSVSQELELWT